MPGITQDPSVVVVLLVVLVDVLVTDDVDVVEDVLVVVDDVLVVVVAEQFTQEESAMLPETSFTSMRAPSA